MIVIIDYNMGNLGSILNMLKRIGVEAKRTSDPFEIGQASKLILPGVGAFDEGMENLHHLGILPLLNEKVLIQRTPILGLCLGMQLFSKYSEEGRTTGLGWIDGQAIKFQSNKKDAGLKVPHMGWNNLHACRPHYILHDLEPDNRYYFVHSYHVQCNDNRDVVAMTFYGAPFVSVLAKDSIVGLQFHPEKSLRWGMQMLQRFAAHDV